jgi:dimethylargininase
MLTNQFKYSHCLVRGIPQSFLECLKQHPPSIPIDISLALQQHEKYTEMIKNLFPDTTIEVAIDEDHPDCCFIEDTCIIVGNIAIISNMGALERRGEEISVKNILSEFGMQYLSVKEIITPGTMDGGDILSIGNDLFVGISNRTNREALNQLGMLLEGKVNVYGLVVPSGLHLKSLISGFDQSTIIVAEGEGEKVMEEIKTYEGLKERYTFVIVPDEVAANVLRINDTLIIQDGFPRSEEILEDLCKKNGVSILKLNMSELIKADGALTCCSLLVYCNVPSPSTTDGISLKVL